MNVTSIATSAAAMSPALPAAASSRTTGQSTPAPSEELAKIAAMKAAKPSDAALQQAVDASNKVLESKTSNELHFAVEKGTGINVVKLISRNTGETLLQFPSEAMLQIAKSIDQVTGAIIQRKA
jgi:flagellar protein FlaG